MSDKRRKYSSGSSDDSYEREKRKKSKNHHKEHRRKHKWDTKILLNFHQFTIPIFIAIRNTFFLYSHYV